MKTTAFILIFALAAGGLFAEADMDALKADLNAAAAQRTTGVVLTVAGGLFLAGGIISSMIESAAWTADFLYSTGDFSNKIILYSIWEIASYAAVVLGGVGLGVGIPFIIVGNIKYHRAQRRLNASQAVEEQSWRPFVQINPYPCGVKAGILFDL